MAATPGSENVPGEPWVSKNSRGRGRLDEPREVIAVGGQIREFDAVRTVTATEASRSFAALLDEAERGETVVIARGGRRIAAIGPASASNGAEVRALLARHAPDADFADDVLAARHAVILQGPAWPDD